MRVLKGGLAVILVLLSFSVFSQRVSRLISKGKLTRAKEISQSQLLKYKLSPPSKKGRYPLLDHVKRTNTHHNLGRIFNLEGNYPLAQIHYSKADSAYERYQMKGGPVNVMDFLLRFSGVLRFFVGQSFDEAQKKKSYIRRIETAGIYRHLGRLDSTKAILNKTLVSMAVAYTANSSLAHSPYFAYGDYHSQLSQYDSSKIDYELYIASLYGDPNTFDFSVKRLGDSYAGSSESYLGLDKPKLALASAKKSWRFANHRFTKFTDGKNYFGKLKASNLVAESYRQQGKLKEALKWSNKAFRISQTIKDLTPEKLPMLATRGQIYWVMADTAKANACFAEMSNIFFHYTQSNFSYLTDSEREYFYRSSKHYLELAKGYYTYLYFQKGYRDAYIAKRLYEIHLNNKGILLNASSKLLGAIASRNDPALFQEYVEIKRLRERKEYLLSSGDGTELKKIDQQIEFREKQLRSTLAIESERYVGLQEITRALPDSTHLMDILKAKVYIVFSGGLKTSGIEMGKDAYYCFILSKNEPFQLLQNGIEAEVLENRSYKGDLNAARFNIKNEDGFRVYLQQWITNVKYNRLIISPDGIYNLINPEILYNGKDYLFTNFRFLSTVSAKDLLNKTNTSPVLKNITMVGWPDYGTHLKLYESSPSELPGTQAEIEGIAKVLPGHVAKTFCFAKMPMKLP